MSRPESEPGTLSRRAVLMGGAGMVLLSACGSSKGSSSTTTVPTTNALLAFFTVNDYLDAGVPHRLAFGIGSGITGAPERLADEKLEFTIVDPAGKKHTITSTAHGEGLPWSYFPFDFTPPVAGTYATTATVDGSQVHASFAAVEPGASPVPGPGAPMPAMKTPTTDDLQGIDPLCTADPPCPFHTVSLDEALKAGRPVAYLVSTPKFCQSGICGPVLEVFGATAKDRRFTDKVTFIHQEVYQSAKEAAEKGANATLSTAVAKLALPSEPVLFLIEADGTIHRRLDAAFDGVEVADQLRALLA